jgi:tetratricopeptide (TPR) repeat protein
MPDNSYEAALARGLSLHGKARWDETARFWQGALEQFPERGDFRLLLGIALLHCNEFEQASLHFNDLRERLPGEPLGDLGTGMLLEACQEWDKAAQTYHDLLKRFPDHPAALTGLARTLVKNGRRNRARALLGDALARNPDSHPLRAILEVFGKPSKADIANQLIRRFGLHSFLEYNKPLGGLVIHDVECREKSIAYITEHRIHADQNSRITQRAQFAVDANAAEEYLGLEDLIERYHDRRFDLIFYDPMHVRPEVDHAFQLLPRLLNPDGFLVVHDCNPEDVSMTSRHRHEEAWLGETYKAFANFHRHNPGRSMTVAEDFGVGIILNRGLVLDYPIDFELDYEDFAKNRKGHIGLISYASFCSLLASGDRAGMMEGALAQ